jgi:MFS family permease
VSERESRAGAPRIGPPDQSAAASVPLDARRALRFIVAIGVVSLFADMTYEGARSITGPYLALLGASGTAVGIVAGGGELLGYALRLWSGRLADRTGRYWAITLAGYVINLLAVPCLALTSHWAAAAVLIVLERVGRAIRTPARDVMLSYATSRTGRGWGYGLHEALDQTGATVGPLVVAGVLLLNGSYRIGFAVLLVPALVSLGLLLAARRQYPRPHELESATGPIAAHGLPRVYWVYTTGACLVAAGYVDYPLVAYHFERAGSVAKEWIPVLYAIAMAVDGVSALAFGRWFDRRGIVVLVASTLLSALFAPFAFLGSFHLALLGVVLWGIGMGAQDSVMRAIVAEIVPRARRGTAFGLFHLLFGVAWFGGSALMGWLYDFSLPALVVFSVVAQAAALPFFLLAHRAERARRLRRPTI